MHHLLVFSCRFQARPPVDILWDVLPYQFLHTHLTTIMPPHSSSPPPKDQPAPQYGSQSSFILKSFIAGGLAGMCAKTSTAPLDRLKILLQVQHTSYKNYSVFGAFKAIYHNEGFLCYYKGNGAMMVRVFPYAAIQFMSYEQYKQIVRPYFKKNSPYSKFLAGSLTGITAVTLTYPLDMVRARLAYQVHEKKYTSIWKTLTIITKEEGGFIGLYRGYSSSILGMIPYAGTAFFSYELIKSFFLEDKVLRPYTCKKSLDGSGTTVLNIPTNLFVGGMAGAISQSVSYPLDVCRRYIQLEGVRSKTPHYPGVLSVLIGIHRTSGIMRGLYRGMSINFYRVVPQVSVSFSVYELLKQFFGISKPV